MDFGIQIDWTLENAKATFCRVERRKIARTKFSKLLQYFSFILCPYRPQRGVIYPTAFLCKWAIKLKYFFSNPNQQLSKQRVQNYYL